MASACTYGKIVNRSNKESKKAPFQMIYGVVHASNWTMRRQWAPNELPRGSASCITYLLSKWRRPRDSILLAIITHIGCFSNLLWRHRVGSRWQSFWRRHKWVLSPRKTESQGCWRPATRYQFYCQKSKQLKRPKQRILTKWDKFAASPVGTIEEALSFLTLLNSSRSQRLQKRKISAITPPTDDDKLSEPSCKNARETPELPYITNSLSGPYSPVLMKSLEDIGTGACSEQGKKNETPISPLFGASIDDCIAKIQEKYEQLEGCVQEMIGRKNFQTPLNTLRLIHGWRIR